MNIDKHIRYWAQLIRESEGIGESGWSKPRLDVEALKLAVERAKTEKSRSECDISPERFGKGIDFDVNAHDFNATVDTKGMVILQDGFCEGVRSPIKWTGNLKPGPYTQFAGSFMIRVSEYYAEQADDDVLEWKVGAAKPYDESGTLHRYVIKVSPYAIDRGSERLTMSPNNGFIGKVR